MTVFIDNSFASIMKDQENSFLINTYKGERNDYELLKYLYILKKFFIKNDVEDIRLLI